MSNTYSQIYIHVIFRTANRSITIDSEWEEELYKYISGIIQNKGQKLIAVNGAINHIHLLIGMKPSCCLSDLIREIKKSSINYIKLKRYVKTAFRWQRGFGAFSCGHSQLERIVKYIQNQKEHHRRMTCEEEYIRFLEKYGVDFKREFMFGN